MWVVPSVGTLDIFLKMFRRLGFFVSHPIDKMFESWRATGINETHLDLIKLVSPYNNLHPRISLFQYLLPNSDIWLAPVPQEISHN